MMTNWPWALVGVILGFLINRAYEWQKNSDKSRALLRGVLLEISHAEKATHDYVITRAQKIIWSPGYRLSTDFLKRGVIDLSELGALRPAEVEALHALYICADEANRSLERLAPLVEQMESSDEARDRAKRETRRARRKFQRMQELLGPAKKAAEAALARLAWHQAPE